MNFQMVLAHRKKKDIRRQTEKTKHEIFVHKETRHEIRRNNLVGKKEVIRSGREM